MKSLDLKVILLVVAALIGIVLIMSSLGIAPAMAIQSIFKGSVGGPVAWRETLREMTPLLMAGAAVFIALRAGLFNIGADGQLVVGAAASVAVVLAIPGSFGIFLACVAAMGAGAIWAFPAAWIKTYRGGHEVISTIMLNNIAGLFTIWLASSPMRDPGQQSPTTRLISTSSYLPTLVDSPPFRLSLGWLISFLTVGILAFWLTKSVKGYELNAVGANPEAAEMAGIDVKKVQVRSFLLSGGLAGLAGAILALGFEHRFYANFSPGYGFDALGVALLAGRSAFGIILSALAFAILGAGTTSIQLFGVPKGLNGILLGLLIIVFAAQRYRKEIKS